MNGIQIERMLNLIEETSAHNRPLIRQEVVAYLNTHMEGVARALATDGDVVIPTTRFGGIRLSKKDLGID